MKVGDTVELLRKVPWADLRRGDRGDVIMVPVRGEAIVDFGRKIRGVWCVEPVPDKFLRKVPSPGTRGQSTARPRPRNGRIG